MVGSGVYGILTNQQQQFERLLIMQDVEEQKLKLTQKKNRLAAEEIRLKLKERKMRTRNLIEIGGLVVKAGLDYLPTNTLFGALLESNNQLNQTPALKEQWTKLGKAALDQELKDKTALIIKFDEQPDPEIRKSVRDHGLRWNRLRQEWYGYVYNLDSLKTQLANLKYHIELIDS